MNSDLPTLYAVSTGSGRAGIAIIRMSGLRVSGVLTAMVGACPLPRQATFATIRDPATGIILDRGMAFYFVSPKTVTGEDAGELHLHGSPAVVEAVLQVLSRQEGLRLAEPGEFTRRAYQNGKMNLLEVEALSDLLAAGSEGQRRLAMRQFTGETSMTFEGWRQELIAALAMVEASIDFADEDGVAEAARVHIQPRLDHLSQQLAAALEMSGRASALRRGVKLVIAGPPNAGKSSLLNWLAKREAAIVSPIAGTTRDVIETQVMIDGFPVTLTDTAGLRGETRDAIEAIGIGRAQREIAEADFLVWVDAPDVVVSDRPTRTPDIIIHNKSDLSAHSIQTRNELRLSLKTGDGLDLLMARLRDGLRPFHEAGESAVVVRERHAQAVRIALALITNARDSREAPLEVVAEDLRGAAHQLASITGQVGVEDLLGKIFSEFCIGK
jgi:tRNA modification GTPase